MMAEKVNVFVHRFVSARTRGVGEFQDGTKLRSLAVARRTVVYWYRASVIRLVCESPSLDVFAKTRSKRMSWRKGTFLTTAAFATVGIASNVLADDGPFSDDMEGYTVGQPLTTV